MTQIFNQYSYVFISLGILLVVGFFLRFLRIRWHFIIATLVAGGVVLGGAWLLARPSLSDVNDLQAAETLLTNGKPTFVEFFSQYCLGCVSVRPEVERLVAEIDDQFNILRVDIHTNFGRALREKYTFSFTPEFVLFDTQGEEVWRAHVLPSDNELILAMTSGNS